jgi:hypothetical protein
MDRPLHSQPCQDFHENIRTIAHRPRAETAASVALCSPPPIGEDASSVDPFQSEINRRIEVYSAINLPARAVYRDAFRVLALKKSPGEVARMNGRRFHTDGVHFEQSRWHDRG